MEQSGLARWSVDELAVLYTLQAGVPARLGLRHTACWCDVMDLFGSSPVANKLLSLTGFVAPPAICRSLRQMAGGASHVVLWAASSSFVWCVTARM